MARQPTSYYDGKQEHFLSNRTVHKAITAICRRYGLACRSEAIRLALTAFAAAPVLPIESKTTRTRG